MIKKHLVYYLLTETVGGRGVDKSNVNIDYISLSLFSSSYKVKIQDDFLSRELPLYLNREGESDYRLNQ